MPSTSSRPALLNDPTIAIVLSYLWLLSLVPLLTEKADENVRWHARHGFAMMVAEVAFWIAFAIFTELLAVGTLGFGVIIAATGPLVGMAFLIVHGIAIYKGVNGQRLILPVITELADRF